MLNTWIEGCDVPLLTAFMLGLLTAVSPCPLVTNITAIGFIGKEIENRRRAFLYGMLYTLGRMALYTLLGGLLIYMLRSGLDTFALQTEVNRWGERLIAPVLCITGILMLVGERLPFRQRFGLDVSDRAQHLKGAWGSFLLGMLFAAAFCPTSGFFYFGMLIPLSASSSGGYALPLVYALATGLPVVAAAWILAYSVANIAGFYRNIQAFQRWFSRLVAILFVVAGLYYAYTFYL